MFEPRLVKVDRGQEVNQTNTETTEKESLVLAKFKRSIDKRSTRQIISNDAVGNDDTDDAVADDENIFLLFYRYKLYKLKVGRNKQ